MTTTRLCGDRKSQAARSERLNSSPVWKSCSVGRSPAGLQAARNAAARRTNLNWRNMVSPDLRASGRKPRLRRPPRTPARRGCRRRCSDPVFKANIGSRRLPRAVTGWGRPGTTMRVRRVMSERSLARTSNQHCSSRRLNRRRRLTDRGHRPRVRSQVQHRRSYFCRLAIAVWWC
jgi:hypothetical protein